MSVLNVSVCAWGIVCMYVCVGVGRGGPLFMWISERACVGFPSVTFVYFPFVKLMETVQKWSGNILLNLKINDFKNMSIDFSETIKKKKPGAEMYHIVSPVWNVTVSSASTGPANNQQDNSQGLSSKITTMAVCLTPTLTSSMLLLLFFFSLTSFPCDQG